MVSNISQRLQSCAGMLCRCSDLLVTPSVLFFSVLTLALVLALALSFFLSFLFVCLFVCLFLFFCLALSPFCTMLYRFMLCYVFVVLYYVCFACPSVTKC